VHDTSSKNAKLSSATTSFSWRHTNISRNHGYNSVADDSCRTRNSSTSFPWRHTNTSKNHGYNAVADDLRRQPFHAEDSALVPDEGQVENVKHFWTIHTLRSLPGQGEMCAKFGWDRFRNVNLYNVQTNKQTFSFIYKIHIRQMCRFFAFHVSYDLPFSGGLNVAVATASAGVWYGGHWESWRAAKRGFATKHLKLIQLLLWFSTNELEVF